jgi:hypothetical protein
VQACQLYEEIAATLTGVLNALRRAGEAAEPLSRAELEVVKAHQKTILMVLDFEAQLLKQRPPTARTGGGTELDLDAARAEVAGRLARLAGSG